MGSNSSCPIRTNLRAQQPSGESVTEKLSRIGMLFALVHLTASPHATGNGKHGRMKWAIASQSFHQGKSAIADDLGKLDQTALLILPGQEHDEPMLQQNADQFGIQLAQNPPAVCRAPLVDLPVLFPKLVEQFNLPALAL